jgi:hypothetical protein
LMTSRRVGCRPTISASRILDSANMRFTFTKIRAKSHKFAKQHGAHRDAAFRYVITATLDNQSMTTTKTMACAMPSAS